MNLRADSNGFTLLELMVAIAIVSIVVAGIVEAHHRQTRSKVEQDITAEVQQNVRAAMMIMADDIRMAGFDPNESSDAAFGITDITDQNGFSQIELGYDEDEEGDADADETVSYFIYESGALGTVCLGRQVGTLPVTPLAHGIEAIGLAYAYDNDGNGQLDNFGGNTIWAVDSDGDGDLDSNLDDNGDGVVDINDTEGGAGLATLGLATDIPLNRIRAVQIWALGRSRVPVRGFTDTQNYVVGPNHIAANDSFKRRMLVNVVKCRNLGL